MGNIHQFRNEWNRADESYAKSLRLLEHQSRNRDKVKTLIQLASMLLEQGDFNRFLPLIDKAEHLAQQHQYNDYLASLRLLQGIAAENVEFDERLDYFKQALIYALRYNRFLLDEVLSGRPGWTSIRPIIPFCLASYKEGRQVLIALSEWWETGTIDIRMSPPETTSLIPETIALLEAERIAREYQPGDGSPQKSVIEQIEVALYSGKQG